MSRYVILLFLWCLASVSSITRADTVLNCTPAQSEVKGPVSTWRVSTWFNVGPYTNELNFVSSNLPGSVDITPLKNALSNAFTSSAWVDLNNGVSFSTIDYVPGGYTFYVGTPAPGYSVATGSNQSAVRLPSGNFTADFWVTMKVKPVQVTLPTLWSGSFTVQATGLLGYFYVYGTAVERRYDAPVTYNCTATPQPTLTVSPVEIDFGTVVSSPYAPTTDRTLSVTVPQAGVSGQVGIEFISTGVTEGTRIPLGHSWVEIIDPANGKPVQVSTAQGQNGLLLKQDTTRFTLRLHPDAGDAGQRENIITLDVIWI